METTGNHRSAASLLCFLTGVPVSSGHPDTCRKVAHCHTGLSERKSWDGLTEDVRVQLGYGYGSARASAR